MSDTGAVNESETPSSEPDPFESMTDDDLRAFIKDRDGKAPHYRAGRDKLLSAARGDSQSSAEIESEPADEVDVPAAAEAEEGAQRAAEQAEAAEAAEAPTSTPAAAAAALDAVELRVAELVSFLRGELHHFEDGVDGVCKLIADRLKAAI